MQILITLAGDFENGHFRGVLYGCEMLLLITKNNCLKVPSINLTIQ